MAGSSRNRYNVRFHRRQTKAARRPRAIRRHSRPGPEAKLENFQAWTRRNVADAAGSCVDSSQAGRLTSIPRYGAAVGVAILFGGGGGVIRQSINFQTASASNAVMIAATNCRVRRQTTPRGCRSAPPAQSRDQSGRLCYGSSAPVSPC